MAAGWLERIVAYIFSADFQFLLFDFYIVLQYFGEWLLATCPSGTGHFIWTTSEEAAAAVSCSDLAPLTPKFNATDPVTEDSSDDH